MYKGKPLISAQFVKKENSDQNFWKKNIINLTSIACVLSRNDFTQQSCIQTVLVILRNVIKSDILSRQLHWLQPWSQAFAFYTKHKKMGKIHKNLKCLRLYPLIVKLLVLDIPLNMKVFGCPKLRTQTTIKIWNYYFLDILCFLNLFPIIYN